MDTKTALAELGVNDESLSEEEKKELDERGYLILEDMVGGEQLAAMRQRFDRLLALEDGKGREAKPEADVGRLANLVDKGSEFALCYSHPKVLAAVWHVVGGEMHLGSLNGRSAPPGRGNQALHCDNQVTATVVQNYGSCNSLWMLDDFTPDNGATRLVPGTHHLLAQPRDHMADPEAEHPDQELALGRAGSVIIFNGITWHGGTVNRTGRPRRAVHCFWLARQIEQQTDQAHWLSSATIDEFSPPLRFLIHV
ncbi:MAG: phytanoyl-CoA dioxygenase family protein [Chloroflexota bacterium]|nr:phytanoyl-CoA dioxygenase family protein [Chloroflexota bacterium]